MSEIMDYQEEKAEEALEDDGPEQTFATIGGVYSDGVSLLFDGADGPSAKHYKVNQIVKFQAGNRVYIVKDSGTYVVICPVGRPGGANAGIGWSNNYAGTSYINKLYIGTPSSHWVLNGGAIYHDSATENDSRGLIGGYVANNVTVKKPLAYLDVNGNIWSR